MDSFKLLLILPDRINNNILASVAEKEYLFPFYGKTVGENAGFDEPQEYNDFFRNSTGISVFRRYSFNTDNYVVFVFEAIEELHISPESGYSWIAYDEFIDAQADEELRKIAVSVKLYYNKSNNMPWVNSDGFGSYLIWLRDVCIQKKINLSGEITQVKNAYVSTVFRIPADHGNLYMKIPGKVYITELPFTRTLIELGIAELPVWVDYNLNLNVFLMKELGGNDLPPQPDINTLAKILVKLSKIQQDSVHHLGSISHLCLDYRLSTILHELKDFPQKAFNILSETMYSLTQDDFAKLNRNIRSASELLENVNNLNIPDTIQHGDIRPGNIRTIKDDFIFYDWSWGAVSHPFVEIALFLHVIRRNFPSDVPAKEILTGIYLREWQAYGTLEELKHVFDSIDEIKELIMAYQDYCWLEAINACNEPVDSMSADGWLLERRNYYFARVLKRFIYKDFNALNAHNSQSLETKLLKKTP